MREQMTGWLKSLVMEEPQTAKEVLGIIPLVTPSTVSPSQLPDLKRSP